MINGDGRRHDLLAILPSGKVGRPVVWYWQDVRTRKILAYVAGETESADLVRVSLHEVITVFGVPKIVLVDSTRAASAKWATGGQKGRKRWRSSGEELPGLLLQLDIGYSATTVDRDAGGRGKGRGRAKPVERAFRDLSTTVDKHPLLAGAYTGRSTTDRPETHRSRAVPWETFVEVLDRVVAQHNARTGRRTEAAAGRSFDEVWAEEFAATVARRLAPSQAAILLLAAEDTRVQDNGCIRLKAGKGAKLPPNRYRHDDLVGRAGERVVARFDPQNLHAPVHVFDAKGRYLCAAECHAPYGFRDASAPKKWEGARKRMRKSAEAGLKARRDMEALQDAMASAPAPEAAEEAEPAAIRLVTGPGVPAAAAAAQQAPPGRSPLMEALVSARKRREENQ